MKRIFINHTKDEIISHEEANIHKGILVKDTQGVLLGLVCFSGTELNVFIQFINGNRGWVHSSLKEMMTVYSEKIFYQL